MLSIDPSEKPADARSAQRADVARFDTEPTDGWHYLTGSAAGSPRRSPMRSGSVARFDASEQTVPASRGHRLPDRHRRSFPAICSVSATNRAMSGLGITRAANGVTARALPILLLCFHYDPATGRYTLAILRVLQLGAAITIMVVGGTVMLALRRERRSQ